MDNIFVVVGNRIYRQCIGIPMGIHCWPTLSCFIMNMHMKNDFNRFNTYSDDLFSLNNMYFAEEIPNIYPAELVLKKTTESFAVVLYLDISITISDNKFWTLVFDKRDSFNFHIVNLNIPTAPAYGVYISQLVKIGRICDEYSVCKQKLSNNIKTCKTGL